MDNTDKMSGTFQDGSAFALSTVLDNKAKTCQILSSFKDKYGKEVTLTLEAEDYQLLNDGFNQAVDRLTTQLLTHLAGPELREFRDLLNEMLDE